MNIDRMIHEAVREYLEEAEDTIAVAISEAVESALDIESLMESYIERIDLEDMALDILLD